jgi:hypothetical protein
MSAARIGGAADPWLGGAGDTGAGQCRRSADSVMDDAGLR